jgi:hypothetical protein
MEITEDISQRSIPLVIHGLNRMRLMPLLDSVRSFVEQHGCDDRYLPHDILGQHSRDGLGRFDLVLTGKENLLISTVSRIVRSQQPEKVSLVLCG